MYLKEVAFMYFQEDYYDTNIFLGMICFECSILVIEIPSVKFVVELRKTQGIYNKCLQIALKIKKDVFPSLILFR